jgi:hypothetical protein
MNRFKNSEVCSRELTNAANLFKPVFKKKLMVIALGVLSNGEITIAMGVLRRLLDKSAEVYFVTHKNMMRQVLANGFPVVVLDEGSPSKNRAYFLRKVNETAPDLIICADAFTMDFASTWSGIDLNELKATGRPIGTFDEYEWESTNFLQDFSGIPSKMKSELITESDFLIRPCPLNKPTSDSAKNVIYCSLFELDTLFCEKDRDIKSVAQWREKMGLPDNSKIVLIVNSPWEYLDVGRSLDTIRLMKWLPQIMLRYLSSLNVPLTILHVGGREWPADGRGSIDYRHYPRVDSNTYNRMIHCADLFCGTNLTSVTMSRAILCGIPCALLQNDKYIDFTKLAPVLPKMPQWYREMASEVVRALPFKVFPWGWYQFLKPVMENNPYMETFDKLPLFEPKKCVKALGDCLFNSEHISEMRKRQMEYINLLNSLSPVDKILEMI